MLRRLIIIILTFGFIAGFMVLDVTASDPQWQEKQQALFEQIGLKPGDVVERANWQKVDGLLPSAITNWVKNGYTEVKVAELKYDMEADDEWINAGPKNAGKYKLDGTKNLVDAATGKPPLWVYGIPFPKVDLKNDPDSAAKFMYNHWVSVRRVGSAKQFFTIKWIGKRGLERELDGFWGRYYYWARPDGQTRNPSRNGYMDLLNVLKPYELAGTAQLTIRKIDGSTDDLYVYIPAIRRVKKMSGANRSDPYMGSDFCVDDGDGWSGLNMSMKWEYLGSQPGLLCVVDWVAEHTNKMRALPHGAWKTPASEIPVHWGYETKDWKGALWAPTNVLWVPRDFVVVKATPIDPYYNFGGMVFWIDKNTYWIAYKVLYDKAGDYWKSIMFTPRCFEWGDKKGVQAGASGYYCYDEKTNHASMAVTGGVHSGTDYSNTFNSPKVNPRMFTVERLRMWSK